VSEAQFDYGRYSAIHVLSTPLPSGEAEALEDGERRKGSTPMGVLVFDIMDLGEIIPSSRFTSTLGKC
jgi:hypothetical protein